MEFGIDKKELTPTLIPVPILNMTLHADIIHITQSNNS